MQKWFNTLKQHVIGAWGEQGEQWLVQLPSMIEQLQAKWSLTDIQPINFPSFNYVAFCEQEPNIPVVLKVSCDEKLIEDEYRTHQHFSGKAHVKVLAYDQQYHAVLLERAVPGDTLKLVDRDQAIPCYADIVQQLQSCEQNDMTGYQASDGWLKTIDRISDARLISYVPLAKQLINFLDQSPEPQKICHGDLHLENIILHGENYLAIDPKGVIGECAFEVSAFDLLTAEEIKQQQDCDKIIKQRIKLLAKHTQCEEKRLLAWFYLRCLISAQWSLEDQQDPMKWMQLLQILATIIDANSQINS